MNNQNLLPFVEKVVLAARKNYHTPIFTDWGLLTSLTKNSVAGPLVDSFGNPRTASQPFGPIPGPIDGPQVPPPSGGGD